MDAHWPKRPLIALLLVVPLLIIVNPFTRHLAAQARRDPGLQAQVASRASHQGPYVLEELNMFARSYWARVAGRDTGLKPKVNGHGEFARRWVRVMKHSLRGLGVTTFSQPFPTPGFKGLPAVTPGLNHMILVPGSVDSRRAVVLVAHYDGEPSSKGSAYDDTSGAAILLGLARVLGRFWRHHGLPSVSVELILFDGEEQGLVGSGAYLFDYRHHALMPKPLMMLDEEQTGVGYPAHPFGLANRKPMAAYATTTRQSDMISRKFGPIVPVKKTDLMRMRRRLLAARKLAFRSLAQVYPTLQLRGGSVTPFKSGRRHFVRVGQNPVCCSDNAPFEALGLPTMTYSGDFRYYDHHHPSWSFPFDQPQDTPKALACDTGGSRKPNQSLKAALDIPVILSALLVQDYGSAAGGAAHISVMGMPAIAGASTSFAAAGPGPLHWTFGDGGKATGHHVSHTYAKAGTFSVEVHGLHARDSFRVAVATSASHFKPPFGVVSPPRIVPWHPSELNGIPGCP